MNRVKKSGKKMFNIDENSELLSAKLVPPLKLCNSPRALDTVIDSSSMSYRTKRRNQVHKSLDFNLSASLMLTPRVIKADHNIIPASTPRANTFRKLNFGSTVTVNNRTISKNLFLDTLPM